MFGKLTWQAIPFDQPIPLVAGAVEVLIILAVLAWVVLKGYLPYLWDEWITRGQMTARMPRMTMITPWVRNSCQ